MKSKTQVIRENSKYRLLINAVLDRIGYKEYKGIVQDVNNSGAYAGYSGFTYYSETHAFTIRYRKYIIMLLENTAEQMGQSIEEMVAGFGVFSRCKMDLQERRDLYKLLGGGKPSQGTITNVMAWFALEEVCRMFNE